MEASTSLLTSRTSASATYSTSKTSVEKDPTLDKLQALFEKVRQGSPLTRAELSFLDTTSRTTDGMLTRAYSSMFGSSDDASVAKITFLSSRVIGKTISGDALIAGIGQFFDGRSTLTTREAASIAGLLSTSLSHDPSFDASLKRLLVKTKQKTPRRDQLIDLVSTLNAVELPKPSKAGTIIARVPLSVSAHERARTLEVRYNARGHLEIIDGAVAPMDTTCSQTITKAQLVQMKRIYNDLAAKTDYNNLAMVMEFSSFVKQEMIKDPTLKLDQAFKKFNPNLIALRNKYKAGTCGALAETFCHEVERQLGIKGQRLAQQTVNAWMKLPIPGTESYSVKWRKFSEEVQGADHTNAGFVFKNEEGKENFILFLCSFEADNENEIQTYSEKDGTSGLGQYFDRQGYSYSYLPDRVLDDSHIAKSGLKARFKGVMSKNGKTLGVDFLRGNVYLNPSWSKSEPGLPLNAKGMAAIDLSDLATPDRTATYTVNGEEVVMTHRQALKIMLTKASAVMEVPRDLEDNLITTAQIAPHMSRELYIQPLPFIQAHYRDLQAIGKKYNATRPTMERVLSRAEKAQFDVFQKHHDKLVEHLAVKYDPPKALAEIATLMKLL